MLIKTCALVFTSAPIPCLNHWSLVKCLTIACSRKPLWHPQTLPRLPSQDWHCDPRGAPKQRGNPHRFHPPGHLEEHGLRGDLDELDPNVSILPPQGKRRRNRSNVEAMAAKHNNPTEHNDPELTNGRRINLKCGMKTNMMLSWCVGQKMLGWCVVGQKRRNPPCCNLSSPTYLQSCRALNQELTMKTIANFNPPIFAELKFGRLMLEHNLCAKFQGQLNFHFPRDLEVLYLNSWNTFPKKDLNFEKHTEFN